MSKRIKAIMSVMLALALIVVLITACGPPEIITETFAETEFAQAGFFCQDEGLTVDLQPGKLVCSGQFEGQDVVIELAAMITDTGMYLQIQKMSMGGADVSSEEFASTNDELKKDIYVTQEGYEVTEVTITDDELIVTSSLKSE